MADYLDQLDEALGLTEEQRKRLPSWLTRPLPGIARLAPNRPTATDASSAAQEERSQEQFESGMGTAGLQRRNIELQIRQREEPDHALDRKLDEYVSEDGQRMLIFQRPDGSTYEKAFGTVREKEPTERLETTFSVWRKQHPNADVAEYFRSEAQAREDVRNERPDRETPAQRQARVRAKNLAETQKNAALARAENEFRRRYGLTGLAATETWPQEATDELAEMKQRIQDEYETKLTNLGEDVRHFDYSQQGQRRGASAQTSATPQGGGQVLDRNNPEHRRIAAQILAEPGGDKNKAREIDRSRNFKF